LIEKMNNIIDLRSDTVTRPSHNMRLAIQAAEVGDDHSGEDPSVNKLESVAAEFTGKEAALYVPSGTMSNLVALLTHCQRGDEVITGSESHINNHEGMGAFVLGGFSVRTVDNDFRGRINPLDISEACRSDWPTTKVICLENTHNRCGGSAIPKSEITEISTLARERGIQLHIDGARIANAAVALETDVASLVEGADSVSFCFSKGLGAPVGSVLCGTKDFIKEARHNRRLVGGAMRQSGVIAEGAHYALTHNFDRLAEDHENAQLLRRCIDGLPGVILDPAGCDTNLVFFELDSQFNGDIFRSRLSDHGVRCSGTSKQRIRMVCHLDVSTADIEKAAKLIGQVLHDMEGESS
jgi:threonine aldolase